MSQNGYSLTYQANQAILTIYGRQQRDGLNPGQMGCVMPVWDQRVTLARPVSIEMLLDGACGDRPKSSRPDDPACQFRPVPH